MDANKTIHGHHIETRWQLHKNAARNPDFTVLYGQATPHIDNRDCGRKENKQTLPPDHGKLYNTFLAFYERTQDMYSSDIAGEAPGTLNSSSHDG